MVNLHSDVYRPSASPPEEVIFKKSRFKRAAEIRLGDDCEPFIEPWASPSGKTTVLTSARPQLTMAHQGSIMSSRFNLNNNRLPRADRAWAGTVAP
jgi:hypothetical protein